MGTKHSVVQTSAGWVAWAETASGVAASTLPRPTRAEALAALGVDQAADADGDVADLLRAYFAGDAADCSSIALDVPATAFQAAVREVVCRIPRGATMSYGEVAAAAGYPGAARAVGQVMATNPVPPFIPCHRVLAANGGLGGYGGGLALKERLLQFERGDLVPA